MILKTEKADSEIVALPDGDAAFVGETSLEDARFEAATMGLSSWALTTIGLVANKENATGSSGMGQCHNYSRKRLLVVSVKVGGRKNWQETFIAMLQQTPPSWLEHSWKSSKSGNRSAGCRISWKEAGHGTTTWVRLAPLSTLVALPV